MSNYDAETLARAQERANAAFAAEQAARRGPPNPRAAKAPRTAEQQIEHELFLIEQRRAANTSAARAEESAAIAQNFADHKASAVRRGIK